MKLRAILLVLIATGAFATTQREVALLHLPQPQVILAARGDTQIVEAFDDRTGAPLWFVPGIASPRLRLAAGTVAAFADPIGNRVVIVNASQRSSRVVAVPETPVALAFDGETLFVASRDGRSLTMIGNGEIRSFPTAADPTHLAVARDHLYVYSATAGALYEFDPEKLDWTRSMRIAPFAADFATDQRRGYFVFPRSGKMLTVSLASMKRDEEFQVAAVPVDIELEGGANLISAGVVAVADPSSKRIWRVERSQSDAEAFGRGFLRGLVGLGLYSPRSTEYPTGVDRVWRDDGKRLAWDSSAGRLYDLSGPKPRLAATLTSHLAATVAGNSLVLWNEARQTLEFRRFGS